MNMTLTMEPIGLIRTPYKEKFAVPRQPGLVPSAEGTIILSPTYKDANCLRGIEHFSHLWLIFSFHQTREQGWRPLVRPPRLGGNDKIGVFASRSTFRPNGIGMSVVELRSVDHNKGEVHVTGMDLVDATPILDIKPYLSYSDSISDARGGYANTSPDAQMLVEFSSQAKTDLRQINDADKIKTLVTEVLAQDPRPAYQKDSESSREYGVHLDRYDVKWRVENQITRVISIRPKD